MDKFVIGLSTDRRRRGRPSSFVRIYPTPRKTIGKATVFSSPKEAEDMAAKLGIKGGKAVKVA